MVSHETLQKVAQKTAKKFENLRLKTSLIFC